MDKKLNQMDKKLNQMDEKINNHSLKIENLEERVVNLEENVVKLDNKITKVEKDLNELIKLDLPKKITNLENKTKMIDNSIKGVKSDLIITKQEIETNKLNIQKDFEELVQKMDSQLSIIDTLPKFEDLDKLSSKLDILTEKCLKLDEHDKCLIDVDLKTVKNKENITLIEKKLNTFNNLKLNLKDYDQDRIKMQKEFETKYIELTK